MNFLMILFFALALPCSFESSKTLRNINFCTLIGQDCIENKCNYYEKCPLPFVYKCGINKCARNASDCMAYLKLIAYYNSGLLVKNAKLAMWPDFVEKTFRKQEELIN